MVDTQRLRETINEEGEVHAVLEEHDAELELRKGQVYWEDDLVVQTATEEYVVDLDRIVSYYVPDEIWH